MLEMGRLYAQRYRVEQRFDKGGYSVIYRGQDVRTGETVAIKMFQPSKGVDPEDLVRFRKEYELIETLDHPHLIKTVGYFEEGDSPCIVTPLYPRGSLYKYLDGRREGMSQQYIARLLRCVGGGLAYMHARRPPLLHNDIKPDNILIAANNDYVLMDFGVSTEIRQTMIGEPSNQPGGASTIYASPERFELRKPTSASDVFSFGVLLFECCEGILDPGGPIPAQLINAGMGNYDIRDPKYPLRLRALIAACLEKSPDRRPTAEQLAAAGDHFLQSDESWPEFMAGATGERKTTRRDNDPPPERKTKERKTKNIERERQEVSIQDDALSLADLGVDAPDNDQPSPPTTGKTSWLPWGVAAALALVVLWMGYALFIQNDEPPKPGQYSELMQSHGNMFDRCLTVDGNPLSSRMSEAELVDSRELFNVWLDGTFSSGLTNKRDLITKAVKQLRKTADGLERICNCRIKVENCQ